LDLGTNSSQGRRYIDLELAPSHPRTLNFRLTRRARGGFA
jgi:hypothetical protein